MARIRSVKPDFWDSPSTAKASLRGRLLYIAMWNWADDWGVGDANARRLLGFAFPSDECSEVEPRNFRHLAEETVRCFGVVWYEVGGRSFYQIPTWEDHQRTEKRARRSNPASDQAERFLYGSVSENPPLNRGSSEDGSRKREGGRGKGEVTTSSDADASDPTPETNLVLLDEPPAIDPFDEFWAIYPRKDAKRKAQTAYRSALKRASSGQILVGARRYRDDPNREIPFTALPTTWLNGDRWEDGPIPARKSSSTRPTTDDRVREGMDLATRLRGGNQPQIGAGT